MIRLIFVFVCRINECELTTQDRGKWEEDETDTDETKKMKILLHEKHAWLWAVGT